MQCSMKRKGVRWDNIIEMAMDSIEDALTCAARGQMVVVLDDKCRENEGDHHRRRACDS